MNTSEFSQISAILKVSYSWAKMFETDAAIEVWYRKLKDIPFSVMAAVVDKWVETKNTPPTIADLRSEAAKAVNGEAPIWTDGWEQVRKAISRYGSYRKAEALSAMDPLTAKTVELLGWQQICESENVDAVRANFRMTYEVLAKRQESDHTLSEATKARIEAARVTAMVSGVAKELTAS